MVHSRLCSLQLCVVADAMASFALEIEYNTANQLDWPVVLLYHFRAPTVPGILRTVHSGSTIRKKMIFVGNLLATIKFN